MYHMINIMVYIISVLLTMIGLSCINFDNYIKKNKLREFYLLYIIVSVAIGYLFASFILSFSTASFY